MVQRVFERASSVPDFDAVVVATDDARIAEHVKAFGGNVVMTSANHPSGTDRCLEALEKLGADDFHVVVNIQGDEPFIEPAQIEQLINCFLQADTQIATLAKRIDNPADLDSAHKVKVAIGANGNGLYFSRHAVPFLQGKSDAERLHHHTFYRHLGLYGYRAEVLQTIAKLPPSPLEKAESLEQLRWLENGYQIRVAITEFETPNIDTPEDLQEVLRTWAGD